MRTALREQRGFQAGITLVELVVVMVIMGVVSTLLVGAWISLQRSYAFTSADNQARATARDALARISSEIRAAQPSPMPAPTSTAPSTPFYTSGTASPNLCNGYDCSFYTAYNNSALADGTGGARQRLMAIWLDTSGTAAQKTLYWQPDTNGNGVIDPGDTKYVLATDVVNTALSPAVPVFTYFLRDSSGNYTTTTSLTSGNWTTLVSVQVELIVDANLSHTPRYIDIRTMVEPRNQSAGSS